MLRPRRISLPPFAVDSLFVTALFAVFHFEMLFMPSLVRAGIDTTVFFQPTTIFAAQNLVDGVIPLWNPHWFTGFPHLAAPRVGVLYPTTFIYGLMDFRRALKIDILLHLWVVGIAGYALGRELFKNRLVSVLLAVPLMSGGFVWTVFRMGHIWTLHTLAIAPIVFLFLIKFVESGHSRWAIGFTLGLALQYFAGDLQTVAYQLVCLGGLAIWMLAGLWRSGESSPTAILVRGGVLLACVVLASGVSAPQLLPAMELVEQSIRSGDISPEFIQDLAFEPRDYLIELAQAGQPPYGFVPFVAGPLGLALAFVALVGGSVVRRYFFVVLIGGAAVYTIMPDLLAEGLIEHVPVLSRARAPYRMQYFLILGFHVLSCFGILWLFGHESEPNQWRFKWSLLASLLLVIGGLHIATSPESRLVLLIICGGSLALAVLVIRFGWRVKWLPVCLVALFIAESYHFVRRDLRPVDMSLSVGDYTIDSDFLAFSGQRVDDDRIAVFTPVDLNLHQWWFHSGMGMVTGDRFFWGFHGLYPENLTGYLEACAGRDLVERNSRDEFVGEKYQEVYDDWLTESSARTLELLNVRYLISKVNPLAYAEAHLYPDGPYRKSRLGDLHIYENEDVFPQAFTVHDVRMVANEREAYEIMNQPTFDYRRTVVLTEPFEQEWIRPSAGQEIARVTRAGINRVEIHVDMISPGFLVLSDLYYPGWRVEIDEGQVGQVYEANTFLRGVFLDEGAHRVRFYFVSESFQLGLVLAAGCVGVLALWAVLSWIPRRPGRDLASAS